MFEDMSTVSTQIINGLPVTTYNVVPIEILEKVKYKGKIYNGFYISYNNYDVDIYGSDTTALVLGQMEEFLILNGDHIEGYRKLSGLPFSEYLNYFRKNEKYMNKFTTIKEV